MIVTPQTRLRPRLQCFNLRIEILIIDRRHLLQTDLPAFGGFNLRIEILIIDSPARRPAHRCRCPVSISELRFLSLIGLSELGRGILFFVSISELRFLSLIVKSVCGVSGAVPIVSISELRFLSLIDPSRIFPKPHHDRFVSISELRFLSLIAQPSERISTKCSLVSISELRFLSLIVI